MDGHKILMDGGHGFLCSMMMWTDVDFFRPLLAADGQIRQKHWQKHAMDVSIDPFSLFKAVCIHSMDGLWDRTLGPDLKF